MLGIGSTLMPATGITATRDPGPSIRADIGVPAAAPKASTQPSLTQLRDSDLAGILHLAPPYARAAVARVKIAGAFTIAEPPGVQLTAARAIGFLPVTLSFSDGQCYLLRADYFRGGLSNGRLDQTGCLIPAGVPSTAPPSPPNQRLQLVGTSWVYAAWADSQVSTTILTDPYAQTFQPLFTIDMTVSAIMAMNGPGVPGGNVTLVGRLRGRLTVVTLEVRL